MSQSNIKKILSLVAGIVILLLGTYVQDQHKPQVSGIVYDKKIVTEEGKPIKVVEAVDGDTVVLANGERLRYIGIDTPESMDPRKPVQCFAHEAAERNRQLVEGKDIIFYKDVSTKDIYDRWLGFVYLADGTFVNLALVKDGYAFSYRYPPDISKTEEFKAAENFARTNKLGLWGGQCEITTLSTGREQTNEQK